MSSRGVSGILIQVCSYWTAWWNVWLSINVKYLKYAFQPNFPLLSVFSEEYIVTRQSFDHELCSERQLCFICLLTFEKVEVEAFGLYDIYESNVFLLDEFFTVITCLSWWFESDHALGEVYCYESLIVLMFQILHLDLRFLYQRTISDIVFFTQGVRNEATCSIANVDHIILVCFNNDFLLRDHILASFLIEITSES